MSIIGQAKRDTETKRQRALYSNRSLAAFLRTRFDEAKQAVAEVVVPFLEAV